MYNWFTLLYSRNQHNIVNQLYSNKNFFKKDTEGKKITEKKLVELPCLMQ